MSFLSKLIVWIVPVIWLSYPVITAGFDVRHVKIVGTHYTGSTWAPAFWSNLNIHDVHDDLLEIKQNGFNTIIIVVPWIGFQISVEPIRYFEEYFRLLDTIFLAAQELKLGVILRIGYPHEIGVTSAPGHYERAVSLFSGKMMLNAWLKYLERLNDAVSKYDNFLFGFLTWEDFFFVDFTRYPIDARKELAVKVGYQEFLKKYSLDEISVLYEKSFSSYGEVPIPKYNSVGVPLFFEFWDRLLVKIYKVSKEHFPNLSMEVRVDCDPSHNSAKFNCHEVTFDFDGEGDITVVYYSPAWGAANKGDQISADGAATRFKFFLNWVKSYTDNLIFIDQFNFVDDTPGFEGNTRIIPGEVSNFIDLSVPIILDNTIGYALWSMKDVRANVIKNGSFERGNLGWGIENGKLLRDKHEKQSSVLLKNVGRLEQHIVGGTISSLVERMKKRGAFYNLAFKAKRRGRLTSDLSIKIISKDGHILFQRQAVLSNEKFDTITLDRVPLFSEGMISVENSGADAVLDDFELFCYVQGNGVYDVFGTPKDFCDNVIALNRALSIEKRVPEYYDNRSFKMASIEGLYEDGWAGNIVSGELLIPSVRGRETFVVEIYVPDSWESYNNAVTVIVNDMTIGSYQVKAGFNKIRFTVDTESMKGKILPFKIIPEDVYVPSFFDPMSEDKRKLSFVLVRVGFVK